MELKDIMTYLMSHWIAVASLLVASLALYRTWRNDRKKAIKDKKALIRAKGYKSGNAWTVQIWNDGNATARNIKFISDDIERDDSGIYLRIEKEYAK